MSGTSMDGVDGVLADFARPSRPRILAHASLPLPSALRALFARLNHPGHNELEHAALAGNQLADLYAQATGQLLRTSGVTPAQVRAIGAHGQTVRHDPDAGYTIQVNAPARLAQRSGIAVVADFRSRDIAAGGQGAPLVPAFHQALFSSRQPRVILNLGGIANVTVLAPGKPVTGFDTGPANALLDAWIQHRQGHAYDDQGRWAAQGKVHTGLLQMLLNDEPWLRLAPPKSTGRHLFNLEWLSRRLDAWAAQHAPISDTDVQATLQAFTARTVADAISAHAPESCEVVVCGGGAHNPGLMADLARQLPCPVRPTTDYGVPVQLMEALAFAWLARAWHHGEKAGLPAVTGAGRASVLGCLYPA